MFQRLVLCLALLFVVSHPNAFAKIQSQVIYGEDNRVDYYAVTDASTRRLADSTVALLRASQLTPNGATTDIVTTSYGKGRGLCATEPFYNQEFAAFCSGSLVAPDLILTAGHCVQTQKDCEQVRFVFGFRLETADLLPHSVPTDHIFSCKEIVHTVSNSQGEDFAVVRLDRAVTHVQPLAYRTSGKPQVGDPLEVMGHPSGLPLKIADGANVRDVKDQFLLANLDTYAGNSGSAVFSSTTGQIEGVLVRGERDFQYKDGCFVSNLCPSDGCRGEDVTLFERVLPYLNATLSSQNP